jgi:ABC-type antimicrobial peptide transport system, ATPase component
MSPIVQFEGVSKSYSESKGRNARRGEAARAVATAAALSSIDLSIGEGEFVALVGPSGSGKTTLLNIAGALDEPSSGKALVCGAELAGLGDRARARLRNEELGFVFQSFNLIPALTVAENVELPLRLSSKWRGRRAEAAAIAELIAAVGLSGLESRFPPELSGGQRQRVAVARALAAKPRLVLADEPTANLDRRTGESLMALMRGLNAERGVTFLFSTHDPAMMAYASRLVRLADGRIEQ